MENIITSFTNYFLFNISKYAEMAQEEILFAKKIVKKI